MKIKNLPKKIYLQIDADGETPEDFNELFGVTWCADRQYVTDLEYILAKSLPKDHVKSDIIEESYLTEIKEDLIKCPECFQLVSQKELDKFGGLCEVCMDDLMID